MTAGARSPAQRLRAVFAALTAQPLDLAVTAACLAVLAWLLPPLLRWAITDAVWTGSAADCRAAAGACWLFIREKSEFIVFGLYPASERWRAIAAILLVFGLFGVLLTPLRGGLLVLFWVGGLAGTGWLLLGGFGLTPVRSELIGGVPLSLYLPVAALSLGFPLAILLAYARRSASPVLRGLGTAFTELFRNAPFITILFVASVMLPFFVPPDAAPPKLVRAVVAFTCVAAAYMAEAVRGGLQAIPAGQAEAARALGLRAWQIGWLVTLPQAIRHAIPGLGNVVVLFVMATTLLSFIGMSDFLAVIQLGSRDPDWAGFEVEGYVFAAVAYLGFCGLLSLYLRRLERRFALAGTR